MVEISKEEISHKMFFIREENSNQPIAVVKVSDLMKFDRPQGEWIYRVNGFSNMSMDYCSICNFPTPIYLDKPNFCPNCGSRMKG